MHRSGVLQVLPVVHYLNRELALEQVELARFCGANGVFLISHHSNDAELVQVAAEAKQLHPELPIGINLLSDGALSACRHAAAIGLDMVWADDMGVDSRGVRDLGRALSDFGRENPSIQLFASVAFKYQPLEIDPPVAAWNAQQLGFTPTTSGSGTGSAPSVEKIIAMSAATGGQLAIASGMTPENVAQFAPHLSHILVATGVGLDEYRIDPQLLNRLIWNARNPLPGASGGPA